VELNKSRETRLELESNLKESQLNTLKGQINPHFMFNSLNNIRGLMLEDVTAARNMLTSLSETLRYSLTKSESNSIALEDELDMVKNYIELSKIQLESRLQFESFIDENSLSTQIPPMIIQMLIENAIKHGISNLIEVPESSKSIINVVYTATPFCIYKNVAFGFCLYSSFLISLFSI
jgi:LytS/YehU family sensor histidine kinase